MVGVTLNADIVRTIGQAIGVRAHDLEVQTLIVARDGRHSSGELTQALIEGLRSVGCNVIDIGQVPTPLLYFATYYFKTGSGVMVTGSHNPPEYNGLKIMLGTKTLHDRGILQLLELTRMEHPDTDQGRLRSVSVVAPYMEQLVRSIAGRSEDLAVKADEDISVPVFKLVVDCGNGVAGEIAPQVFRALGHQVIELYCDIDGSFPNHHPNPSVIENLHDLIDAVIDNDADLGFAFDGDGDRLGVVDREGHVIWPDRQMMLFSRSVLAEHPGAEIIFDVKCSNRLSDDIKAYGGNPIMWRTGHSLIKTKMQDSGALLAGEMSGHVFFADRWYGFDDALYSGARLLEILGTYNLPPSQVFAELPAGISTPELRITMAEGQQWVLMQRILAVDYFADGQCTTIDGLRVDYADAWGLVRASNTEPSLVLRFEADDQQALARIQDRFKNMLNQLAPDLRLPF